MQKTYAIAGAAVLLTMILGSGAAVLMQRSGGGADVFADCRGSTVVGGTIGGPFTLVNGDGATVTDAQILDKPALVYFGYGFCPDVCPLDNARNAEVAENLAAKGLDLRAVFISVDPKRDTPQMMKDYASNVSPLLVGLTGSPEQIQAAAKEYKVFYNVPDTTEEFYTVDHTTFTYLMLPGRGFMDVFDRDVPAEDMEKRVACYLDKAGS